MDGNQKLEGGRVERTGGHNAKERTPGGGGREGGLGIRKEEKRKNKDEGRRKKITHHQESY